MLWLDNAAKGPTTLEKLQELLLVKEISLDSLVIEASKFQTKSPSENVWVKLGEVLGPNPEELAETEAKVLTQTKEKPKAEAKAKSDPTIQDQWTIIGEVIGDDLIELMNGSSAEIEELVRVKGFLTQFNILIFYHFQAIFTLAPSLTIEQNKYFRYGLYGSTIKKFSSITSLKNDYPGIYTSRLFSYEMLFRQLEWIKAMLSAVSYFNCCCNSSQLKINFEDICISPDYYKTVQSIFGNVPEHLLQTDSSKLYYYPNTEIDQLLFRNFSMSFIAIKDELKSKLGK